MGRHRSSATAHPRRRSTLLAATGLALSAAVVPAGYALAGNATSPSTSTTDGTGSSGSDGSLLDIDLPAICLDLQAKVTAAQDAVDNAPESNTTEQNKTLADALATAKAALADEDQCDEDAPTTTTPPPTTTTPLPPVLGGTGGQGGTGGTGGSGSTTTNRSTTINVPGSSNSSGDTSGDSDGDGSDDTITPSGSADTGGWGA